MPPVGNDITQDQPDELRSGFVAREVASGLDDLAQLHIDALNGVRGVDGIAYRWRKRKEQDHAIPCAARGHADHREFLAPEPIGECIQLDFGSLRVDRRAERSDRSSQRPPIFPA